jgi:acyl-CoA thioesterase FadM
MTFVASQENCSEFLVGDCPITVRRRVLWAECDPAQIVYTGRFFDYAAAAYYWFMQHVLAKKGLAPKDLGLGTPMKAISFEFKSSLRPDEWFEMQMFVDRIRTRTFDLELLAYKLDGTPAFSAIISPIMVTESTKKAVALPGTIRNALEDYKLRCTQVAQPNG